MISSNPTYKCHHKNCNNDGKMCMELHKEIYFCKEHFREFIDKTANELRNYLLDRGFYEKRSYRITNQPVFWNDNIHVYFSPMFLSWRIKDKSISSDMDITHITFDFDEFTISDQEKSRMEEIFSKYSSR